MSASNFFSKNTNKVYSYWLENTDEDNDFFQEDLENLQEEIISDLKNELKIEWVKIYEDNRYDNERNYSWHIFGNILIEDNTEEEKHISIDLITRSWYYQWVNFDYEYSIDNSYWDDDIPKNLQEKFDKCIDIIEKSYDKFTLALRRVATFSNGETIYEPVKK
jgi:hypothetical protein